MTTHDTEAASAAPGGFADIRATLEEVGVRMREISAKRAEDHALAMREMAELREQQKEVDRLLDRQAKEAERRQKEAKRRQKETARQMKETDRRQKETARQMKETDRRLKKAEGLFTSQWGKLMESLVRGDLVALLNDRGIEVEKTLQRMHSNRNGEHYEIDILALNGREVVVVEVKTTLRSEGVTEFLSKLSVFLDWCPEFHGKRIFGAVAYLDGADSVTKYAARRGLFVIRATGSSARIVNAPDFKPHAFS